jgi:hypothetical protein
MLFKVVLAGSPVALWWACSDVRSVAIAGDEFDRYAVSLTPEESALLKRASAAGLRDPAQLLASAFYRSPSFAVERLGLLLLTWHWESNGELYARDWKVGSSVGGVFTVVRRSRTSMNLAYDLGQRTGQSELVVAGGGQELQFATYMSGARDTAVMRVMGGFHGVYSRVLLAGAKFKLMRDAHYIVDTAAKGRQ